MIAAQSLTDGSSFPETFWRLVEEFGFTKRVAFLVTRRVFRAGGSTKDASYLCGLKQLLEYLNTGKDLEQLDLVKFAISHLPALEEFRKQDAIQPPRLLPLYYSEQTVRQRLAECFEKTVIDLTGV